MDTEKYKAEVEKDAQEATELNINGTPTFVLVRSAQGKLDDVRIVGAQPFASMQSAIDALLKEKSPNGDQAGSPSQQSAPPCQQQVGRGNLNFLV